MASVDSQLHFTGDILASVDSQLHFIGDILASVDSQLHFIGDILANIDSRTVRWSLKRPSLWSDWRCRMNSVSVRRGACLSVSLCSSDSEHSIRPPGSKMLTAFHFLFLPTSSLIGIKLGHLSVVLIYFIFILVARSVTEGDPQSKIQQQSNNRWTVLLTAPASPVRNSHFVLAE